MSASVGGISLNLDQSDREFNPWIIALTVTVSTFMEVLDTSIANLSLPHIAGSMAATYDEATWVLTSYLVSNAVVLPLSGWVTGVMGRKRFNMTCVAVFTISSMLCGMATSLPMLIFFRILQGIGGGGLQPSVQAILLDTFPLAKRGMAMAVYSIAVLVAPVLGPTLGGWITDSYSWRWIFYINLPVGVISLLLTQIVLRDPPYMIAQRAAQRGKPRRVDFIGLGLVAIGLSTLEMVLDKGQEVDWFSSRFILSLSIIAGTSLVAAVIWELCQKSPIVNVRLFGERNFMLCCVICFGVYATLYATTVLLPQMLQTLMGYSATEAGLVLSPAALVTMLEMPIIGILLSRGVDARKMIACGLLITAGAAMWMSRLNLQVSEADVIWPRVVQVLGAGLMFVPINTIAYRFIPKTETNNASGLFSLVRNEGGSIGVALVTTLLARHTQMRQASLVGHVNLLNPIAVDMLHRASALFGPADPTGGRGALALVYALVQQQAAILSYMDLFQIFAGVTLLVVPLVLFMRGGVITRDAIVAH
ncbi:MAG TPA: DHA2 family efflux MFS transporter permease subunit [Tepidisphaeraceae bacterium]|jgi:DHA2 family multidrug resistance protein|nr:DHA2 family efflux MFS transporter permease subunit [Tepidisphaeraceae bacterium]